MDQGRFSTSGSHFMEQEEHKRASRPVGGQSGTWLKKFALLSNSMPAIHKSVNAMIVDQQRSLLYSTGKEKYLHCQDLQRKVTHGVVKCSNATPSELEIDEDLQRLYVATREGMVLIFDISYR